MRLLRHRPDGHGDPSPVYYVYMLYIIHNGRQMPIYAGKGSRGRMDQHLKTLQAKLKRGRKLDAKERLILLLMDLGYEVFGQVIESHLTEDEAFNLENETIRSLGLLNRGNVAYPHRIVRIKKTPTR